MPALAECRRHPWDNESGHAGGFSEPLLAHPSSVLRRDEMGSPHQPPTPQLYTWRESTAGHFFLCETIMFRARGAIGYHWTSKGEAADICE